MKNDILMVVDDLVASIMVPSLVAPVKATPTTSPPSGVATNRGNLAIFGCSSANPDVVQGGHRCHNLPCLMWFKETITYHNVTSA